MELQERLKAVRAHALAVEIFRATGVALKLSRVQKWRQTGHVPVLIRPVVVAALDRLERGGTGNAER